MQEARASWNMVYSSKEGFECHITLRDDDEQNLILRAQRLMAEILKGGGRPLRRKASRRTDGHLDLVANPLKTYVDERGVRRCGMELRDGSICGTPIEEKDGRHGKLLYCPNYKNHAK